MSTINFISSYTLNQAIADTLTFPVTFVNTAPSSTATIIVAEDLTFTSVNSYFIMGSSDITIEGGDNTITISNVANYPGLVRNGTTSSNGYQNITIQNLILDGTTSTLDTAGGWIGHMCFATGVSNNQIINCSSKGQIGIASGGIVGQNAAYTGGILAISKCYSLGDLNGDNAGGIAGQYCGYTNGTVTISNCYSMGDLLGINTGGIVGYYSGQNGGYVTITNCYSRGQISGINAGGIVSYNAANTAITNCYSTGIISGINAGGIAGYQGASGLNIRNSYSCGLLTGSPAGGIIGNSGSDTTIYSLNCYSEGNNSNSGNWSNINANIVLTPSSVWVALGINLPYYLAAFNAELYTPNTYTRSTLTPYTTQMGNIQLGGHIYMIIGIVADGGSATNGITIGTISGAIVFPTNLAPDTYTIIVIAQIPVGSTGYGYNFNTFVFTQLATPVAAICFAAGSMVATDRGEVAIEEIQPNQDNIGGLPVMAVTTSIHPEKWVVRFDAGCLGAGVPRCPTVASLDHIVFIDYRTPIRASDLVNKIPGVHKIPYDGAPLYNVLLEHYGRMIVNGIQAETLHPRHPIACVYRMRLDASKKNEWFKIISEEATQMPEMLFVM